MNKQAPPRGGIAGLTLLFCVTAAAAGLAFDFGVGEASGFWIGARPGGAAVIGGAAAAFCVAAAQIAQRALGRSEANRSGNADPHA